jgi:hypothetical protein
VAISPTLRLESHEAANLLDGLVSVNLAQMNNAKLPAKQFPVITGIQAGKIRYRRADPDEHWQSWREIMEQVDEDGRGYADCEDLASAVAAELLRNGVKARTFVYRSGPKLFHVVVKTDQWGLIDPSRAAGMEGNG